MLPDDDYDESVPTPPDGNDDSAATDDGAVCGYPVDRTDPDWPGDDAPHPEDA